ncbi:ATP-binding cassette domain-containing protein [Helicobacter sp.]|uniref:ATP-binding cassette domain-containing protein n=1 Tax=Helicobacter sp. TaxID=218 RepID=UPI0025BC4A74|nr:ATP-binding cassette domain-containing protein [Helicobacter sp.]MCI5968464.1 ATP-binding cassette domain-containing protein [Helicobacter sp.]MDY2585249.1 ATP-binding cassette domain-containing protein [Helicobacter sp.]
MIKVQNLSLASEDRVILNNITLEIKKGERVALIGESGSGKSLLMRSILNLLPQNLKITQGTIKVNEEKIGVILQNPASCFDEIYTIKEHFLETFRARNIKEEKFYLEEVELTQDILSMYPFELSGGMLQRIMIALALSIQPQMIFADEMTSDLDSIGVWKVINLLLNLQKQLGFGLFFITHDLLMAAKIADRVIVLDSGKIIETGSLKEVLKQPKMAKTKEILEENQKLYKTLWGDFSAGIN